MIEKAAGKEKVRLPSDNLTNAQIKKLSGPVKTYRFVPGLSSEALRTWPDDLREEYRKRFGR